MKKLMLILILGLSGYGCQAHEEGTHEDHHTTERKSWGTVKFDCSRTCEEKHDQCVTSDSDPKAWLCMKDFDNCTYLVDKKKVCEGL